MEEWKPVVGYEGFYEVSNAGRVRSVDRIDSMGRMKKGRVMKPSAQRNGYLYLTLNRNGKQRHKLLHRIVAESFLKNAWAMPEVNHIDEDKSNNAACNLEWCDHRQNHRHGTGHERAAEKQSKKVLQIIGDKTVTWKSVREASRRTGAGRKEIARCCKGELKTAGGFRWEYAT